MRDDDPSYSSLSPEEQAAVSLWIEGFDDRFQARGPAALEESLEAAPPGLRRALLVQLLPLSIDAYRRQHRVTPTLHELRLAHPGLATELSDAYPRLPSSYRLPVELHGYRVIRVVGDGGQAVVLRAQDDVHSTVAIKVSTSPQHNDLLLRERRILGECDHPGIVPVIASGMHEGAAYFVMPYLKGKTLADRYATHRPDADEAGRLVSELCAIVEHLHGLGVLHRDIKPANVWVDEHGGVKLIDLGMAIERSRWGQPVSQLREFHGTPAFMSPEQAATDGEQDGELSDVFSIGATLYWLGTGAAPFDGESGQSVLGKAAVGQFDRDRLAACNNWPKRLRGACLEAMAVSPSQRFRSAGEFRGAIEQSLASAAPPKRRRTLALATLLSIAGLSVAATTDFPFRLWNSLVSADRASASVEPEPEQAELSTPSGADASDPSPPEKVDAPEDTGPDAERPADRSPEPAPPPTDQPKPQRPEFTNAQRVTRAKAWLESLPEGTQLGQFIGRRFHPTTLAPIRDAITSIRITTGQERYGPRTISLSGKSDDFWDVPPERIRDNLLRPLREIDASEYAFDSVCNAVAEPVESPFIEIPPGANSFRLTVYFLDETFIDQQLVSNLDRATTLEIHSHHSLIPRAKLFLFREKSIGPDSIATYLKKPLAPSDPNRDYLLRTRVGFYCPRIPRYPLRAASTNPKTVEPPKRIVPGTYYVHHFTSKRELVRVNAYEVTREDLSKLAEKAAYFERELRTQFFDAKGRRRSP